VSDTNSQYEKPDAELRLMKLLLTSLGLSNETIVDALEGLLGQPLRQSRMIYVPTAIHAVWVDQTGPGRVSTTTTCTAAAPLSD